MKKLAAEFIETFALVFAGTSAIVIDETTDGAVTHVGVALTFGLVVLSMIYTVGDISGAHLNPAVSLGFFAARRFPLRKVIPNITMNPARSVGPAVMSGHFQLLWIYLLAPVTGACIGVSGCRCVRES